MPYEVYKVLHLVGIFMVFATVGATSIYAMAGGEKKDFKMRKLTAITHGIGLLLVFVAGFGLLARMKISASESWVLGKMVIWAIFAGATWMAYKLQKAASLLWGAIFVLGAVAVYLVQYKPG